MNYKTISSRAIIAKIYRDLKPKDSSWEVDAVEWIGEALEFIGYFSGFVLKEKVVRVNDYRTRLPEDFFTLLAIRVGGLKLRQENMLDPLSLYRSREIVYLTDLSSYTGDFLFNEVEEYPSEYYYLEPNYIKTSFRSGAVRLQYLAFPVDDFGYPEIPDNIVVKQALEWYILRQMLMGGFESKVFDWDKADYNWKKYCVSAQNDLAYPSIEKMEEFKDKWVRLIPHVKPIDYLTSDGYGVDEYYVSHDNCCSGVPAAHTHPEYITRIEHGSASDMDINLDLTYEENLPEGIDNHGDLNDWIEGIDETYNP